MAQLNLRIAVTALALAASSPALVACADAPPGEDVEPSGTLNAALLTVGSDGATYQFPAGTVIRLHQGNYTQDYPLDGMESSLNVRLPVGTFDVTVLFTGMAPKLVRTIGGVASEVDAVWLDLQPVLVNITTAATTDLTLHFRVTGLGDVTFDMGTLAIALDVQRNTTAQPAQIWENGTYIHASSVFGPTATPEAQVLFAMSPGQSVDHFLDYNITQAWQQVSATRTCTFGVLDAFTTMGESGFSRGATILLRQLTSICIDDAGMADKFLINTDFSGPAPAPFDAALPNGNYRFFMSVSGFVGDVYDGQTLRQSSLETFTSFNGGEVSYQIFDNVFGQETLSFRGNLSGNVRLVP